MPHSTVQSLLVYRGIVHPQDYIVESMTLNSMEVNYKYEYVNVSAINFKQKNSRQRDHKKIGVTCGVAHAVYTRYSSLSIWLFGQVMIFFTYFTMLTCSVPITIYTRATISSLCIQIFNISASARPSVTFTSYLFEEKLCLFSKACRYVIYHHL